MARPGSTLSPGGDRTAARGGFTMIELLVVVTIVVILAALVFPVVGIMRKRATVTQTEALLQVVHAGLDRYHDLYRRYPPTASDPVAGNRLAFYLCADEGAVTPASGRSSALTGRVDPRRISGEQIVDPWLTGTPLIFISTTPAGDPRSPIPLPAEFGRDATDATLTAYHGFESAFELWSAGPDGRFHPQRDHADNADNITVTAPFGALHAR